MTPWAGFDCPRFWFDVAYAPVPWYLGLPGGRLLSGSPHPSQAETNQALEILRKAQDSGQTLRFAEVSGLGPGERPCHFLSKGLRPENASVISFYYSL